MARRTTPPPPPRRGRPPATPAAGRATLGASDLQFLLDQMERLTATSRRGPGRADAAELERLRGLVRQALLDQRSDGASPLDDDDDEGWDDEDDDDEDDDDWDEDDWDEDEDEDEDEGGGGDEVGDDRASWTPWSRAGRFTSSGPIAVADGLAATSRRGAIGATWWSKRFLDAIEPFMAGGRASRGRSYARQGQVLEMAVAAGKVTARVQGSRRTPYKVQLVLAPVGKRQWKAIVTALASQAGYAARLLAGEMPPEMEQVFAAAGASLLPGPSARLGTDCSCPDWANPCKHVGAVCYLLAEGFDRDPFQLLAWRGGEKEELLARLARLRSGTGEAGRAQAAGAGAAGAVEVAAPPLSECLLGFWKAGPELAAVRIRPQATELPGAVLRQLPRGLVDVAGSDLADLLEPAYGDLVVGAERRAVGGS